MQKFEIRIGCSNELNKIYSKQIFELNLLMTPWSAIKSMQSSQSAAAPRILTLVLVLLVNSFGSSKTSPPWFDSSFSMSASLFPFGLESWDSTFKKWIIVSHRDWSPMQWFGFFAERKFSRKKKVLVKISLLFAWNHDTYSVFYNLLVTCFHEFRIYESTIFFHEKCLV